MANISVCIATYNGEKYIVKQIKTILSQTIIPDEIIVSDDNSTDNTVSIIKNKFPKIKVIINNSKGIISNFENALNNATGKYIFLADQDDEWRKDKVEKTLDLLKKYSLINHNAAIIDSNSNQIEDKSFFQLRGSRSGLIKNLYKSTYLGCCMAFRKEILNIALPFPKDIEMHDRWLGLIGECYGTVYFYNETLINYRRHGNNASGGFNKSTYNRFKQLSIRIVMVKNLIKRYLNQKVSVSLPTLKQP